jgi:hypothetical protein
MRKNKSNMYTVQGYKQNGNPAELLIEESVDFCPFCLRTQNLNRENVFVIDNPFEAASIVYRCNTRDCQNPFLVKYECDPMDGIYKVHSIYPQQKFRRRTFPDAVENISPAFVSIYNEALSAENSNLKEVAGAGYRKALEFLIKDYCISEKNAEENKVKSSPLMRCIEDHIDSYKLKEMAKRAAWLGNDAVHYFTIWKTHDLQHLKELVKIMVNYIEDENTYQKYMADMAEPSKK